MKLRLYGYIKNLRPRFQDVSKLRTLLLVLQVAWTHGFELLQVYSDCLEATNLVQNAEVTPSSLPLVRSIQHLRDRCWVTAIAWTPRESNMLANGLAEPPHPPSFTTRLFGSPPPELISIVHRDAFGPLIVGCFLNGPLHSSTLQMQLPKFMPCPCRVNHRQQHQPRRHLKAFQRDELTEPPWSQQLASLHSWQLLCTRTTSHQGPHQLRLLHRTGTSTGGPTYTVQPGDGLFHIAAEVFSRLVLFREIAVANNILDPNLIELRRRRRAESGALRSRGEAEQYFGGIVREFGADEQTLGRINEITAQNELRAEQPIDVPLRCMAISFYTFNNR
ncbi:hypothetical protein F3Y22_tig00110597pilonHSYRG00808 [Hibiscus syriacus]|uniref:LysM domain-containing protein n=1 Tax=Hibiscus syriacus TaxID=106335 RepID=A0A6A3A3K0_HIBSY|nr:hypothetical protein F3Y22_tig00110597pilonHSYRG00808 [Hibiscus syriacus]